jgi:hypothetical protein
LSYAAAGEPIGVQEAQIGKGIVQLLSLSNMKNVAKESVIEEPHLGHDFGQVPHILCRPSCIACMIVPAPSFFLLMNNASPRLEPKLSCIAQTHVERL